MVARNKHKAPDGYEWRLTAGWMSDKKIDLHRLYKLDTMQDWGAVKRGKGKTYINWDTGEEYPDRTSAMIAVEARYI